MKGSAQARIRAVRALGAGSVILWGALGLIHTGVVLSRPETAWLLERKPGADRALGVPRYHENASQLVTAALELIESGTPGNAPVWVARTDALENDTWWYIQMQLGNLTFPREIWLGTADAPPEATYEYAIGVGPETPGQSWIKVRTIGAVTLYRAAPR